ncbi:TIR domain-containing protein [Variovorax sp. J22R115]|uniref:TIR domain-containing protein n=1 Tax=Variovorax sp. J22R115 TaxID=3053509 RepID=UPI0025754426|nr:TIR domain-containing protein [Variovorax sp. J22R115]MDM0053903.1 nucleotide-binding protein [Variovorax sp. J22R115]
MKVFLSWSGTRSQFVAHALRDWLPGVLQVVEPWLSSDDIEKGTKWMSGLERALAETHLGIVCLTTDNLDATWLHFEAGAISKLTSTARLFLYNLDVAPAEISGPLAQFQGISADRAGTRNLLLSLNQQTSGPVLPEKTLDKAFDLWWPQLEASLAAIPSPAPRRRSLLTLEDKVDQILSFIETLTIRPASGATPTPKSQSARVTPVSRSRAKRPRAFIGSSAEALPVANAIAHLLEQVAECDVWAQTSFLASSETYIEHLNDARLSYDFAIFVMTADDIPTSRGVPAPALRDDLVFELGFFSGALGRARTFLLVPESLQRLPSDLTFVTTTVYKSRADVNLLAALAPAMSQIKRAMGIG